MTFIESLSDFGGLTVVPWSPGRPVPDPATSMPKFAYDWDDEQEVPELLRAYLELPEAAATRGIVIGMWGEEMYDLTPDAVIDVLVAAADTLTDLKVLFIGDMTYEENEISWICNTDQSRLYAAYPHLEHVGIRGGNDLRLTLDLPELQTLVIETGGMSRVLLQDVLDARLPALTHLELYTGSEDYGAETGVADLEPLLAGDLFPRLGYLGLRNSEYTDEICAALAGAPVLERLHTLDLSLGTLTDAGAKRLAANPAVGRLQRLDVHHHFLSTEGQSLLRGIGVTVDLSDPQKPEDWGEGPTAFVAIGE